MSKKSIALVIGGGFLLIALLIIGVIFVQDRTSLFGQAAEKTSGISGKPDPSNSFVFASPLEAAANSREKIRTTIIVLSSDALPLSGQVVTIASEPPNIVISPLEQTTDQEGKAYFDIVSSLPGGFTLTAKVGALKLSQQARVEFK